MCMQDFFADVQASFYTCECKIFSHVQVRVLHMHIQDLCTWASKVLHMVLRVPIAYIASFLGLLGERGESLVSTVCACA